MADLIPKARCNIHPESCDPSKAVRQGPQAPQREFYTPLPGPGKEAGFTLLEVLAALAVVALALSATVNMAGQFASHTAHLRDKSFALWVAQDRLLEWQVLAPPGSTGRYEGETAMGNKSWPWSVEITRTPIPGLRRMDVEVKRMGQDENPLVRLSAMLKQKG